MSLRLRLALLFAAVSVLTAAVVAVAAPFVVGSGFGRLETAMGIVTGAPASTMPGGRAGAGPPAGRGPAARAGEIQQETVVTLLIVTIGAAVVASLVGLAVAGRVAWPLRRLEDAASAVAGGDLGRRSGISDRHDELGALGRSFDRMAGDLQQADEARRRMLQDAAHELRTPLAVIDATASALLDGVYEPEPRHLETIREQSRLLARVVDDLRTIGLAEGGRLTLALRPVEAAEALASTARAFEPRAEAAGIALTVEAHGPLWITADSDRLRQMISALLDNALRHSARGGRVLLSVDPAGAQSAVERDAGVAAVGAARLRDSVVRIEVRDTGPGLDPADVERVFDRFYQADPSRARGRGSSGLGLAIVKALVQAHGGRVGVRNVPEGGACFWVELPAADVSIGGQIPSTS